MSSIMYPWFKYCGKAMQENLHQKTKHVEFLN
jgi:hypothetical protein